MTLHSPRARSSLLVMVALAAGCHPGQAGRAPSPASSEASKVVPLPPNPSSVFVDATATDVPPAPNLHALDAALADVDGDGDRDVILAVEQDVNRLYLNDGRGHLTWKQGTFGSLAHDSEHVRVADFDRDGHLDVLFIAEDDHSHQLFLGQGGGAFTDASDRLPARSKGNGVAVADLDGDGLPDIVVGNSSEPQKGKSEPRASGQDFFWRNDPAHPGHFIDMTATAMPRDNDDTQDVACVDVDGDGDLDLFLANETPPSRLLLNDGHGRFTDASTRLDLPVPLETREVHAIDATSDGKPDLLLLNLTSNNQGWNKDPQARLLVNDGHGSFKDETSTRLPANRFSTYGGAILDLDSDGDPDILLGALEIPGFVPLQARAWTNDGQGHFKDETARLIPRITVGRHWSMAVGDIDGDGKDDVFLGAWGTQARLLRTRIGEGRTQGD